MVEESFGTNEIKGTKFEIVNFDCEKVEFYLIISYFQKIAIQKM